MATHLVVAMTSHRTRVRVSRLQQFINTTTARGKVIYFAVQDLGKGKLVSHETVALRQKGGGLIGELKWEPSVGAANGLQDEPAQR